MINGIGASPTAYPAPGGAQSTSAPDFAASQTQGDEDKTAKPGPAGASTHSAPSHDVDPARQSARSEFLKWMQMSPAERIRALFLEEEGLTEESLDRLPAEERERIEDKIKERIEQALGLDTDSRAPGDTRQAAASAYARTASLT